MTLTLDHAAVQLIVNALAMRPYQEVAQLISEIMHQVQVQQAQPADADPAD